MHSHHSHSGQYCTHATGDLEDCIREAIKQKFEIFCLTEHIPRYREQDLYPGETQTLVELLEMFQKYHAHARSLQKKYAGQLEIFVGLETEYIRDIDLRVLELLIAKYPIDMMVGSVHHVNEIPIDFDRATWEKALSTCRDEEDYYGRYFDHQYEVLKLFKPLVVGHFDVVLLFAPKDTSLLRWSSVASKIKRNIDLIISYGGMIELNSAAFRKGWTSAYPKPDIIRLIQESGGTFCISDDSHGPHQVGLNFHRLQEYIKDMGISDLGHLEADGKDTADGVPVNVKVCSSPETIEKFQSWQPRTDV
ncbi:Histidinol-phosphatase [Taphrina deformans PYCC 5710]|uniref:Histidinol-phosphatase n=1 Tax=Taphrina deformans (strain PYCC 5710 / ATCC 11124 / CBS 356.35 / IMI 108563 / JCM 9778 / NBRC 8474) TaxID=1097556 RepID=R4X8U3_TAPDE|nr:Histidinol-phosphatase [Taphrina deformans PYCC 5710]|eukprot:CCG81845.1 Histidinol-phosphatase [Taphrina deformans PYCC 5710]